MLFQNFLEGVCTCFSEYVSVIKYRGCNQRNLQIQILFQMCWRTVLQVGNLQIAIHHKTATLILSCAVLCNDSVSTLNLNSTCFFDYFSRLYDHYFMVSSTKDDIVVLWSSFHCDTEVCHIIFSQQVTSILS